MSDTKTPKPPAAQKGGAIINSLGRLTAREFSEKIYAIARDPNPSVYRRLLEAGIPAQAVAKFAALIGKTKEEVFDRIGISRATAHRLESAAKRISALESDAFTDMVGVVEKARGMLETEENLRAWIDAPVPALNHLTPWQAMADLRGRKEVSHLLDVIAAGTYA